MLKRGSETKVNNQTIFEEQIAVHYEPTQEEINEYGVYIGIDPEKVNQKHKNFITFFIYYPSCRSQIYCG